MCISNPPRIPLEIGSGKALYERLFFSAGGFTNDFPSSAFSLEVNILASYGPGRTETQMSCLYILRKRW